MTIRGYEFFKYLARGDLLNVGLEVTKRCSAFPWSFKRFLSIGREILTS